jgi:hypothetical protein
MTRGKVVLVPFPFDDLETQKARPAICLTDPLTPHRHIVLASSPAANPTNCSTATSFSTRRIRPLRRLVSRFAQRFGRTGF